MQQVYKELKRNKEINDNTRDLINIQLVRLKNYVRVQFLKIIQSLENQKGSWINIVTITLENS